VRKEFTYPLVISCGKDKIDISDDDSIEAYKLYEKGYWQSFRANSPQLPLMGIPTFVLSAKYGLIPHTKKIKKYNKVITGRKTKKKDIEVTIDEMVKKLQKQKTVSEWKGEKKILFTGGEPYKKALEKVGFDVYRLEDFKEFPDHNKRGGQGKQKGALKWFLTKIAPKILSKDNLVNIIIQSLPNRFESIQ
jgi:hypothetical protein